VKRRIRLKIELSGRRIIHTEADEERKEKGKFCGRGGGEILIWRGKRGSLLPQLPDFGLPTTERIKIFTFLSWVQLQVCGKTPS
jgi:hypothetical protein